MRSGAAQRKPTALVCPAAIAGTFQYECEVKQAQWVTASEASTGAKSNYVGAKFVVSRETGEIVGPRFDLRRSQGWNEFRVLDRGSKDQSYKSVAVSSGPYVNTVYVQIIEFEPGPLKLFVHIYSTLISELIFAASAIAQEAQASGPSFNVGDS
ncbi:MAG TPA: hypothetical protein VHP37_15225 [Burkholderiales bacterium]|nr:hypothetical protein [Burkholderiales bacterium]